MKTRAGAAEADTPGESAAVVVIFDVFFMVAAPAGWLVLSMIGVLQ